MSIYKFRDSWRALVKVDSKQIASKSGFLTKKAAQKWHDQMKVKYLDDPNSVILKTEYSMEDLINQIRGSKFAEIKPETRLRYEIDLRLRIEPYFKFMKLKNINPQVLESFKGEMTRKLKSPKTVNNCLALLNMILKHGYRIEMIVKEPYALIMLPVARREQYQNYVWWDDPGEIQKFLQVAKDNSRYYSLFLLALETGMRLGELVGLSKQDIDLKSGRIRVRRQWLERQGSYGPTKNSTTRFIDFDPNGLLARVLKVAIDSSPDPEIIFVTSTGKRVLSRRVAGDTFKRLLIKAGVRIICFHGLRHTFASWYAMRTDDFQSLQYILGHTEGRTTQRYAHLSQRHRRQPLSLASLAIEGDKNVISIVSASKERLDKEVERRELRMMQ